MVLHLRLQADTLIHVSPCQLLLLRLLMARLLLKVLVEVMPVLVMLIELVQASCLQLLDGLICVCQPV